MFIHVGIRKAAAPDIKVRTREICEVGLTIGVRKQKYDQRA